MKGSREDLAVVVLAAGQGVRMRSKVPKVLHPVAGRPMVSYVLEAALALEPVRVALVIGHEGEKVRQALGLPPSGKVVLVEQREQLGTAHAVLQAREELAGLAGTVLVLYGDTPLITPSTLRGLVAHHREKGAAITLLVFEAQDPTGYGRILRGKGGEVVRVVEEREAKEEEKGIREVSGGVFCFRDEWLWSHLEGLEPGEGGEYYLTRLASVALNEGEVVEVYSCGKGVEALGVNDRVQLARVEGEMRRRINERWMKAGVTMLDPEAVYIDAGVEIGEDTVIYPQTHLEGETKVGKGCRLGPGAVIRGSVIGDGCVVELSVVEGAVLEEGVEVGPFSHIRPGSHLCRGVHVGNFGEVKNSLLGAGVKMGHFSYVGDAEVGAGANIGAGTVTCNFDGKRKHKTVIGEEAFIGSGTMLVAPVEVGAGAKTGAGSVVTRDVPPRSLAYGVPARVRKRLQDEEDER